MPECAVQCGESSRRRYPRARECPQQVSRGWSFAGRARRPRRFEVRNLNGRVALASRETEPEQRIGERRETERAAAAPVAARVCVRAGYCIAAAAARAAPRDGSRYNGRAAAAEEASARRGSARVAARRVVASVLAPGAPARGRRPSRPT